VVVLYFQLVMVSNQFLQPPHPIRHTRRHRRSHPQRLVNPTEVVEGEVQSQGRLEVRQLLAEGIRQPGEAAAHHPNGQVLPLHVARADMGRSGIPIDHRGYHLRDPWWGVPPVTRRLGPVHLHKLGIVHIVAEEFLDGGQVGPQAIRGQLGAAIPVEALPEILNETVSRSSVSLADRERRNQLALGVNKRGRSF